MNAHEATPEQLALLNEGDDLARHRQYITLAVAVLMQAIEDATLDIDEEEHFTDLNPASRQAVLRRHALNHKRSDRDHARLFLTSENAMLSFWCWVAGIHVTTLLHYARRAAAEKRWTALGRALRKTQLHHHRKAA